MARDIPLDSGTHGVPISERPRTLGDALIPGNWTNGAVQWKDYLACTHSYPEHINVYEARVAVRSLEVVCKIPYLPRSRFLTLEDNQVTCHIFQKGRAKVWGLNQVCRRKGALEIASDIDLLSPWVRSSRMRMDELSKSRQIVRT